MEELSVRRYRDDEAEALVAFLTSNEWPFHLVTRPDASQVRKWIDAGRFRGLHWLGLGSETVGFLNVEDLDDFTPVFDLRIAEARRGRNAGKRALEWLPAFVFDTLDRTRVEGHTRVDNVAMRKVFEAAGWVREAYHRRAWPDEAGTAHDCVSYALLREDWRSGTTTPVG